jgi:hypothetical protein
MILSVSHSQGKVRKAISRCHITGIITYKHRQYKQEP